MQSYSVDTSSGRSKRQQEGTTSNQPWRGQRRRRDGETLMCNLGEIGMAAAMVYHYMDTMCKAH